MYVLIKTDSPRRLYVARPGSPSSYTPRLENAQTFSTEKQALRQCCPGNEIPVNAYDLIGKES